MDSNKDTEFLATAAALREQLEKIRAGVDQSIAQVDLCIASVGDLSAVTLTALSAEFRRALNVTDRPKSDRVYH
jgi:hypothetical protein